MSVADEIKSKLDIVQYIQRYAPLKKAGRTWKACCPFHSEKTPSFVVNETSQTWRCFGACAEGGDIFNFAMKYNGWSFTEALEELGKLAGVETRPQTPEQRNRSEELDKLRGLIKSAADYFHDLLYDSHSPAAVATLEYVRSKRGLTDETIRRFGIGYAPAGWQNSVDTLKALGYSEEDLLATGIASQNEESGRIYDRFRNRLIFHSDLVDSGRCTSLAIVSSSCGYHPLLAPFSRRYSLLMPVASSTCRAIPLLPRPVGVVESMISDVL